MTPGIAPLFPSSSHLLIPSLPVSLLILTQSGVLFKLVLNHVRRSQRKYGGLVDGRNTDIDRTGQELHSPMKVHWKIRASVI